jgi:hypothetical protein
MVTEYLENKAMAEPSASTRYDIVLPRYKGKLVVRQDLLWPNPPLDQPMGLD